MFKVETTRNIYVQVTQKPLETPTIKQEISLKKINGDQYEKTIRNGSCACYLT